MRFPAFAAVALTFALAACGARTDPPAPILEVEASTAARGDAIVVMPGDTLSALATRHGIGIRELADANGLSAPYVIRVGQRLVLPPPRNYTVQRGDTLTGLGRQFNVAVEDIAQANGLAPTAMLREGQTLTIPGGTRSGAVATAVPSAAPPAGSPQSPVPAPRAAARSAIEIVPSAGGAPPPAVETARTPSPEPPRPQAGPAPVPTPAPGPAPGPAPAAATPATRPAAPAANNPAASNPSPAARPADPAPQAAARAPEPAARAATRFAWPVRGRVVSDFGPKPGNLFNDGINIAAAKGTPVVAADNGVVAEVTNELAGFGNVVLVRHADGWMTIYAHLDEVSVARNARVTRGQTIGTVGQTGSVSEPQLHFEVLRQSRRVNPLDHLDADRRS
jgi:murein DD-endopeptidase MepM/ murein hydrolase activator NlpD